MANKMYRINFSYADARKDDSVLVEAPSSSEAVRRIFTAWDPGTEMYNIRVEVVDVFQVVTEGTWTKFNEANKAA